jgi:TonB family protein
MLAPLQPAGAPKARLWFVVSLCLHVAILGALLFHPEPKLLKSSLALKGAGGRGSMNVVYMPGASVAVTAKAEPKKEEERKHASLVPRPVPRKPEPKPVEQAASTDQNLKPGMPGFVLGGLAWGFAEEHDVRIALLVVSPDPPIDRRKLPDWIKGDVIVEVTIDEQGSVVKTKLLQSVGFGLDDIVVATLRGWRFTPAKVDGVVVASRQDVHFHFPG